LAAHDIEANWAAAEIARLLERQPTLCYEAAPHVPSISSYAGREATASWPRPDSVVRILEGNHVYSVAVEYKRIEESAHGMLTAIGQAHAYLDKGYNGAIVVMPSIYPTHDFPGDYVARVANRSFARPSIGVFTYQDGPDISRASPFEDRLHCIRTFNLETAATGVSPPSKRAVETPWAHVREGSTTRDAFFRYLQTAKRFALEDESPLIAPPAPLVRVLPADDWAKYLSNTVDDSFSSRVWRRFWFTWVATPDVLMPWKREGRRYTISDVPTRLTRDDGRSQVFFATRRDSVKRLIIGALSGRSIKEDEAWLLFADNVRRRAHSYREDIDSGLAHFGLLESDGRPNARGYELVDLAERTGGPDSHAARLKFAEVLLVGGRLNTLLYYIHRLSEEVFAQDPLRFSTRRARHLGFNDAEYLAYITEQMANRLKVLRTVSGRGGQQRGTARKPFQAELTMLRRYGFVRNFRVGVGLQIDWPRVVETIEPDLSHEELLEA
jgi:hypothetical protein